MSYFIVIANTKGGVGKTTTAMYLATAYSKEYSVTLVDADPQGSLVSWYVQLGTPAGADNDLRLHRSLKHTIDRKDFNTDIVIIDTSPGNVKSIQSALKVADLVLIPTAPSGLDLDRVFKIVDSLDRGAAYKVLVTMAVKNTKTLKSTYQVFEDEDINVLENFITQSEKFKQNFGSWPKLGMEQYREVIKELDLKIEKEN